MQEIRRSFPVSVVSVLDSVISVSVLYRAPSCSYSVQLTIRGSLKENWKQFAHVLFVGALCYKPSFEVLTHGFIVPLKDLTHQRNIWVV